MHVLFISGPAGVHQGPLPERFLLNQNPSWTKFETFGPKNQNKLLRNIFPIWI